MSLFNPKDLLFETCVWDSFGRQEATWTLAIEIALLEPGERTLTMLYVAAYTPPHGFVHAGVLPTALDSACGYAALSLMPEDAPGFLDLARENEPVASGRSKQVEFEFRREDGRHQRAARRGTQLPFAAADGKCRRQTRMPRRP